MTVWQFATMALYVLGGVLMMRIICTADEDMTYKASGYEKVFCFVLWPLLAVGCVFVLTNSWLKDRK